MGVQVYRGDVHAPDVLLRVVEKPSAEVHERRKDIARLLLETPDKDLRRPQDDFAIKIKRLFRPQWEEMRATGKCHNLLYCFMLLVWGQAPSDTQDVEGMNFVLQGIATVAPRLGQMLEWS